MSTLRPSTANKTLCCLLGCIDKLLSETCIGPAKHTYPSVGMQPPKCQSHSYLIGAWKGGAPAGREYGRTETCCSTVSANMFEIELGVCGALPFEVRPKGCSSEDLYGKCWSCSDINEHQCDIWQGAPCEAAACVTKEDGKTEIIWPDIQQNNQYPSEADISQCFYNAVEHVICNLPSLSCQCLEKCYHKTNKIKPKIRKFDVKCKCQYLVLSLQISGLSV